jgi:alpha-glucosidase
MSQTSHHELKMASPDKKLQMTIHEATDGRIYYSFMADGVLMIDQSEIGLDTTVKTGWKNVYTKSVRTTWKPLWGKRSLVPDAYNEAVIDLNIYRIRARAYNNGIAFRYEDGKTERELTQFNFAGNFTAWYYKVEDRPLGPEKLMDADGIRLPVMSIEASDHAYMAIHEAALERGQPLELQAHKGSTRFSVPSRNAEAWRVVMFGRTWGELVDSHLIELLNPDPEAGVDFSWVRPGVNVWDWRINGAVADGFKYEMNLPSWKRMIDFASGNNMKALVLDADWYGPEFDQQSDPLKGGKVEQVHQIIQYGRDKGVGVWLYLNDVGGRKFSLEQTLKQYGSWGASGVKYGFMQGNFEEKNERTRLITKLCAQNRLMVDFHDDPVHPYGQMRTWPNAVTREFCHAQLDAHRVFTPGTYVSMVFVQMLAGPIDMNNGSVDMEQKGRIDNPMPVPATITAEIARTLITFSGATIIPDIPEYYRKYPDHLKFLSAQQMPWKESKTLSGVMSEHIVMARQSANGDWLIGAATNESARTLNIPLSFLDKGEYEALVIEDGNDADYLKNKTSYSSRIAMVRKNNKLQLHLAPGGGDCVLLKKK